MRQNLKLYILIILFSGLFIACNSNQKKEQEQKNNADNFKDSLEKIVLDETEVKDFSKNELKFSEAELEAFLDSVGKLNTDSLMLLSTKYPDSVFRNRPEYNRTLTDKDFELLKNACKLEKPVLDSVFVQKNFPDLKIESNDGQYFIKFYSFDQKEFGFDYYAIDLAPHVSWDAELYFFKRNKLISKHTIFHKYGLEVDFFTASDGKPVVYYQEIDNTGSGIWWYNFFFYKYDSDKIIPVLKVTQNSNFSFPFPATRYLWFETEIISTSPLKMKMFYNSYLLDTNYNEVNIITDSTLVKYNWNKKLKIYEPNYKNSKMSDALHQSYYLDYNELLFINTHYKFLKEALDPENEDRRYAVLLYLSYLKAE